MTVYSFWLSIVFITGGVFASWANFFHPNSLMIDNAQPIAMNEKQKFPPVTVSNTQPSVTTPAPKSIPNTQKAVAPKSVTKTPSVQSTTPKNVVPQTQVQANPTPVAAPVSTRTTKTS